MEKKCGVYKIVSPNNRIYVGSSNDIDNRYSFYKGGHAKKQILLFRSFEKYGFNNHSFEILCECKPDERLNKERQYGELLKSLSDFGGLNLMLPKIGDRPPIYSKELIKKFSDMAKNRKYTSETLLKMSKARQGKYCNGQHPMAKIILNIQTGIFYTCIKEAAISIGLKRPTLSAKLTGYMKNNTSLIYA